MLSYFSGCPQIIENEIKAGQEGQAEQTSSSVGQNEDRQYHQVNMASELRSAFT